MLINMLHSSFAAVPQCVLCLQFPVPILGGYGQSEPDRWIICSLQKPRGITSSNERLQVYYIIIIPINICCYIIQSVHGTPCSVSHSLFMAAFVQTTKPSSCTLTFISSHFIWLCSIFVPWAVIASFTHYG